MAGFVAIAALVLSSALLAVALAALVMLRRGEGPVYGASRAYDANRRDALRALTGMDVERIPATQWFDPARKRDAAGSGADRLRETVAEALKVVVPPDRGLRFEADGAAWLAAERARVVTAVSTAALRRSGLERWDDGARIVIALVLFNPEPPGGEATRVALPVQVLFEPLERAGRGDLVERFSDLKEDLS